MKKIQFFTLIKNKFINEMYNGIEQQKFDQNKNAYAQHLHTYKPRNA